VEEEYMEEEEKDELARENGKRGKG